MRFPFPRTAVFIFSLAASGSAFAADSVEFNRDIRTLLSDRCYACHGPDQAKRTSKLRLDSEASAKADLGGRFAVVPGDPAKSEVIHRINGDEKTRMPPAWSGAAKLTGREIDLLTQWVAQGARWQDHWSFIPPKRPALPSVSDARWPKNAIDSFVLAKLDRAGLKPSPEADRRTIIRRVALDLTGLPPTPAEVEAFVHDTAPSAYEKVVDRLLASPRYGERMAVRWLDAARYADTNGYQTDGERSMWRWRDWVIDAFNRNMPFDKFTVEQIAGDMLPNATRSQILATGFNRNHRGNGEGGIIPEEYAVEYVVDRVETTSAVWLGVTLGCARCHNHKYDPFPQKDFYRFFAFFNNVPERGMAFKYGNSPPVMAAPTPEDERKLQALDRKLSGAETTIAKLEPEIVTTQSAWEAALAGQPELDWAESRGVAALFPLPQELGSFDGKRSFEGADVANFGFYDSFTLSAWINPENPTGAIVSRAQDETEGQGLGLYLKDGHLLGALALRWLDDGARVLSESTVPMNQWSHVMLTYDGSRMASGIHIYLNGEPLKLKVDLDVLNQTFALKQPLRIGAGLGPANRFRGSINRVRIYHAALTPEEAAVLAAPQSISEIAKIAPRMRTPAQSNKLRWCYLDSYAPAPMRDARRQVLDLRAERASLMAGFPTVMVMRESPAPRETHVLIRGSYDRPGEKVSPGVPSVLPALTAGASTNRLGLAKWIVDPGNPLTARVTVNRFWQMYFGTGLVKTVEDFGSQGESPLNPELLDWLATEFVRTGWDMKAVQKTIVLSATYRQSSETTPESIQKDPENRLLARGPRLRLPAEVIRDQALAISGLLVEKIGGPSVKPYQPPGLWKELTGGEDYKPDTGDGLHRRSLYTFWKRTSPPPAMMNFDAPGREACAVREVRTNTPLQSLNLMNDLTYLEASRAMAQRMMREGGGTAPERIDFAFRLATARHPKRRESEILLSSYRYYRDMFQTDPEKAAKYVDGAGANAIDLAAYSTVASLILNLDVTVSKE
ncbi:MAG: DUF1553 domain-containing protein [Acidobacteriota bacterium]|nr:DUF1553 domain-containing protein [Acidobacteriota bacterium]